MDIFKVIEILANLTTIFGFIIGISYVGKIYKIIIKNINVVVDKIDNAYIVGYVNKAQIVNVGYAQKDFSNKSYSKGKFWDE